MYKGEISKIELPGKPEEHNLVYLQYEDLEPEQPHLFSHRELENARNLAWEHNEQVSKNPSTEAFKNTIIFIMMVASFVAGLITHSIFAGK